MAKQSSNTSTQSTTPPRETEGSKLKGEEKEKHEKRTTPLKARISQPGTKLLPETSISLSVNEVHSSARLTGPISLAKGDVVELFGNIYFKISSFRKSKSGHHGINGYRFIACHSLFPGTKNSFMPHEVMWICEKRGDAVSLLTRCERGAQIEDIVGKPNIVFFDRDNPRAPVPSSQHSSLKGSEDLPTLTCQSKYEIEIPKGIRLSALDEYNAIKLTDKTHEKAIRTFSRDEVESLDALSHKPVDSACKLETERARRPLTTLVPANVNAQKKQNCTASGVEKKNRTTPQWSSSLAQERGLLPQAGPADPLSQQQGSEGPFTFGDAFCGAGGMSIAARQAGLKVKWAFDWDSNAIKTYHTNFKDHSAHQLSARAFVVEKARDPCFDIKVDRSHFSTPCPPYSSGRREKDKERMTEAEKELEVQQQKEAFEAFEQILDLAAPKMVTFEQVPPFTENREYFGRTIWSLLSRSYDVSWKTLWCNKFGLAQKRERLFIIGSRMGCEHPAFPAPTHDATNYTTFSQAISGIPPNAANHERERKSSPKPGAPRADKPVPTITATGHWPYHHDGYGLISVREGARLQGFPDDHVFEGNRTSGEDGLGARLQVANAVPPPVGLKILEEVKKALSA
ncbi:hypothetical protein ACLMJK_005917 [Lecanora helva]